MNERSYIMSAKSIKEYIYLDNLEVNSILAQFEDGIPKVIEEIKQSTETNTEGTSGKMSTGAKGGFNLGAKGEMSLSSELGTNNSDTNSEMYQEAISTVYHDYAVNIMTKELDKAKLLKTTTKQEEGTFVQLTSTFNIIDPISISSRLDDNAVSFMLSQDEDSDKDSINDARNGFNVIMQFGELLNKFFPDSMLVSTKNALTIAEKNNFRMNESQIKSLVLANRKITVLGKIESIVHEDDLDINQITNKMAKYPAMFTTLMPRFSFFTLSMLDLIKKEDRLIKPIAIYFE